MVINKGLLAFLLAFVLAFGAVVTPFADGALGLNKAQADSNGLNAKLDYSKYIKTFEKINNILKKFGPTKEYAQVFAKVIKYANTTNTIIGLLSSFYEKLFGGGNGTTETPITLETLYNGIIEIQSSLSQINRKLDEITEAILGLEISLEEQNRANIARSEYINLNTFSNNYCKPLDTYIEKYETELNRAFKKWYTDPSSRADNTDIVLLHAYITDQDGNESLSLLMSDAKNPAAVVKTDTGIDADPALTVSIPGEAFSSLPSYNINNCADEFRNAAYAWLTGHGTEQETAKLYAQEAYETLKYRLGCAVVRDENLWRTSFDGIKTAFTFYLDATLSEHTGIDAQLQLMYNVYGFESEARENINLAADQLIARTTLYGMFVLDLLAKNGLTTNAEMTSLMDKWNDTINIIDQLRDDSLTGYDDFCYLTGTRLIPVRTRLYARNIITFQKSKEALSSVYHVIPTNDLGGSSDDIFRIQINGPDGLYADVKLSPGFRFNNNVTNTVSTVMLYHIYEQNGQDSSFADYLTRCGANTAGYITANDTAPVMTKLSLTEELATKDVAPFSLKARTLRGTDFTDGSTYNLSDVSKSRWNMFRFCHRVLGATVDLRNGSMDTDATLAAAFGYATEETNSGGQWYPKNITDFSTGATKLVATQYDYKGFFDSSYYTQFDDEFYRELYILYREPVDISGGSQLNAANSPDPLASYFRSAENWMQTLPNEDPEFTHKALNQDKVKVVNDMGATPQERAAEYEAMIRDEAARAGRPEPDAKTMSVLKAQMEECWQEIWSVTNKCEALQEYTPIELDELEMKKLVTDVINRAYADDPNTGVYETSKENVNMHLIDRNDMNLYLRISPRAAVKYENGAYHVLSCFDVTPMLAAHSYVVKNGNIQVTDVFEQPLYIDDQLSHRLKFNIRIPVTKNSKGGVKVRHFDNWYTFEEDRVYNTTVNINDGSRYVELKGALTGPLGVKGDYVPNKQPHTGDSMNLFLCVFTLVTGIAVIAVTVRKRRQENA